MAWNRSILFVCVWLMNSWDGTRSLKANIPQDLGWCHPPKLSHHEIVGFQDVIKNKNKPTIFT